MFIENVFFPCYAYFLGEALFSLLNVFVGENVIKFPSFHFEETKKWEKSENP